MDKIIPEKYVMFANRMIIPTINIPISILSFLNFDVNIGTSLFTSYTTFFRILAMMNIIKTKKAINSASANLFDKISQLLKNDDNIESLTKDDAIKNINAEYEIISLINSILLLCIIIAFEYNQTSII
ncbi:MAG: hypothetical protein N3A67_09285 [Ignavibacteria bacterium]|jgi:hypothetical protein|nr:hypothetical protein [Ignavibacteria bacterium]